MKISNKSPNIISFGNLTCGEVFKDEHSNYCMKVENDTDSNMVYLSDGSRDYADDDYKVERVRCELVVEN